MSEHRRPDFVNPVPFEDPEDEGALGNVELELEAPNDDVPSEREMPLPPVSVGGPVYVHKDTYRVRLRLSNGESMEGDIYLPHAPRGNPEDALMHWLTELRDGFFPFRDEYEQTSIVHTRGLQWMAAPFRARQREFLSTQRRVRIIMEHEEELDGILALDVRTLSPRVSDLLNEFRPYLSIQTENELFLVNRNAILRVYDLG